MSSHEDMAHSASDTDLIFRYYFISLLPMYLVNPQFLFCVCVVTDNYINKYFQDRDRV
jgi:hypothetical protein